MFKSLERVPSVPWNAPLLPLIYIRRWSEIIIITRRLIGGVIASREIYESQRWVSAIYIAALDMRNSAARERTIRCYTRPRHPPGRDCIAENWIMPRSPPLSRMDINGNHRWTNRRCPFCKFSRRRDPADAGAAAFRFRPESRGAAEMLGVLEIPSFIARLTVVGEMKRMEFSWTMIRPRGGIDRVIVIRERNVERRVLRIYTSETIFFPREREKESVHLEGCLTLPNMCTCIATKLRVIK